ncbi:GNAT family N-acetyltransferase [Streptosporangium amethystogenes]|uniref:GNAT family N-acetyltransferase n=1 Tax=Streptosporangium amethystogenes TaxID=2002 RepID=UPI003790A96D
MSGDVRLREVEEADLELFFEHEHDPETVRRSKFVPRDRERFMTHWTTRVLGDPTVLVRTVTVADKVAGNVVSWSEGDMRFIGYVLGQEFWGRGIGTRAVALHLRQEQTRPLYADPFSGNTGSVRVLEKCGFRHVEKVQYGEHEHLMLVLDAATDG